MPGKQARVPCPVCQEPISPDETDCENCGAFVIDEAVVRLSRALGLDREKALKLFDAGFRHPRQLRDRDPNRVIERGEVGLLFICTNCGGFVAGSESKCPLCAAEFETEAEEHTPEEEDILDIVLCSVCGADNDPELAECEICGELLREPKESERVTATPVPVPAIVETEVIPETLEKLDDFLKETEASISAPRPKATPRPEASRPSSAPPAMRGEPTTSARPAPRPSAVPPRATPKPKPTSRTEWAVRTTPRSERANPSPSAPGPSLEPLELTAPPPIPKQATDARHLPTKRVRSTIPNRMPQKKVRPAIAPVIGLSPETVSGLVLAAAGSLLLAGALGQHIVSAGVATLLIGLGVYVSAGFVRRGRTRPSRIDTMLLVAGALFALGVPFLRGPLGTPAAIGFALASGVPMAQATYRLIRKPERVLLATASSISVIAQGLAATADPTYAMTIAWMAGILAAVPWPAALAAREILRRRSSTSFRRQLARAEHGIQRKDYERSLAEYDRAIAAARLDVPGAEIPWYGKGATLILLGRYAEALHAIDTALDINPRNVVAWVNKGNALAKMGRLVDALRCFNAAIKVNPTYEVAWNGKGNGLARLGKHEDALRCYERALGIDPRYRGAWVNMGYVLTKLGRFDEAASCADRVLSLDAGRRAEHV